MSITGGAGHVIGFVVVLIRLSVSQPASSATIISKLLRTGTNTSKCSIYSKHTCWLQSSIDS